MNWFTQWSIESGYIKNNNMCDNLGISDERKEVFKFTYLGQSIIFKSLKELTEWIENEIESVVVDDPMEITITVKRMRISELNGLPERLNSL